MKVELSDILDAIQTGDAILISGEAFINRDWVIDRVKSVFMGKRFGEGCEASRVVDGKCPLCDMPAETNILVGDGELMPVCMEHARRLNGVI